jgi:hypothetical protein
MSRALRRLTWALLLVVGLTASAAAAPSRLVVVQIAGEPRLVGDATRRLRAELTASGFEVITVDGKPGASPREAVEDAHLHPVATLAIVSTDRGAAIDLWVADHLTGKTLVRRIDVQQREAAVLAIQAVELLRASLLEADHPPEETTISRLPDDLARWAKAPQVEPPQSTFAPSPPPSFAPSPPPSFAPSPPPSAPALLFTSPPPLRWSTAPPPQREERFFLGLGLTTLHHLDGDPPSLGPELRASYRLAPRWLATLDLLGPAFTWPRTRAAGSLSLREEMAMAELAFDLVPRGWIIPSLSLAAGAEHAHVEGTAEAPYQAHTADLAFFATAAGVSARAALAPHVALRADLRALFAFPGAILRVAGEEVGSTGRANLLGSLGVTVSPWW